MENIQDQMNAVLNDPEMMQKIMGLAQSLGQSPTDKDTPQPKSAETAFPDLDISTLQKLSSLAGSTGIDSNQRTLLTALRPYLSGERISKLEKAMRAAKLANVASGFLGNAGFQFNTGR